MIRIEGNHIWRGTDKIGWVEGNHLYNEEGDRVGYWSGDALYDIHGNRLLHIHNNRVIDRGGKEAHLDDVIETIPSASMSEIARVAIKTFFGG